MGTDLVSSGMHISDETNHYAGGPPRYFEIVGDRRPPDLPDKADVSFAVGDELPDDDMRFIQIITCSPGRMQAIAAQHGLSVEEDWTFMPINKQIWLKFKKAAA